MAYRITGDLSETTRDSILGGSLVPLGLQTDPQASCFGRGSKVHSRDPEGMIVGSICDYLYVVCTVNFVSLKIYILN